MNQDEEHLKLLAIFHYILGGITAMFACIPFIHLIFGIIMLIAVCGEADAGPAGTVFALLFILLPVTFILLGWTLATAMILTGRFLQARKYHSFCLVMGGIECVLVPLGTVLGVFTIIVLLRDSVRALFRPPVS